MNILLESEEIDYLATLVEEAIRSTKEGVKRFLEPARGTLRRAKSKQHHIVFGRRGSGKTSLLMKAAADLTVDRRPIAYANLETFKGHSYPDVLLSTLIVSFEKFSDWLRSAGIHPAHKTSFWSKFIAKRPRRPALDRQQSEDLASSLDDQVKQLKSYLHLADSAKMSKRTMREEGIMKKKGFGAQIGSEITKVSAERRDSESVSASEEVIESYYRSKVNFLNRHIFEYRHLFERLSRLSGGSSYLFLDDLYHIRRVDQAKVLDYFHRIAKGNDLWLKVGTIRHRTSYFRPGDPPIGLKLADDAEAIDLDLTLEKYPLAKKFLARILGEFVQESGLPSLDSILTPGAIDRLVLCSGGVARDFLGVFKRSIDFARERGTKHRGPRICAEDVNKAAGEYGEFKLDELRQDTLDEDRVKVESQFDRIRDFCLGKANANCFLLDKDAKGDEVILIRELADMRLIHLVKSRVTVSSRPRKIFEAYMLDFSCYAGSRRRRYLNIIEFWRRSAEEKLRRAKLIYLES